MADRSIPPSQVEATAQIDSEEARRCKRREYNRAYRKKNQEALSARARQWKADNKERHAASRRAYYEKNQEAIRAASRQYARDNIQAHREGCARRYRANREERVAKQIAYEANRMATDVQFRLRKNIRKAQRRLVAGVRPKGSALKALGCSIKELRAQIEGQWLPGMSWDNWTHDGWHLDHRKPLTAFDLTDPVQFAEAFHHTNLQPLWAADNIRKGGVRASSRRKGNSVRQGRSERSDTSL